MSEFTQGPSVATPVDGRPESASRVGGESSAEQPAADTPQREAASTSRPAELNRPEKELAPASEEEDELTEKEKERARRKLVEKHFGVTFGPVVDLPVADLVSQQLVRKALRNPATFGELVESVRTLRRVLYPLLVRRSEETGKYPIIAGEGRFAAARIVGLEAVPCIVVSGNVTPACELWLATDENTAREGLNILDEVRSWDAQLKLTRLSVKKFAALKGKSQGHVSEYLKLLNLDEQTKRRVAEGKLSAKAALRGTTGRDAQDQAHPTAVGSGEGTSRDPTPPEHEKYRWNSVRPKIQFRIHSRSKEVSKEGLIRALKAWLKDLETQTEGETGRSQEPQFAAGKLPSRDTL